ncbi:MAG TPA: cytochrome c-type biogenesis protein CcmH [Clostridia bacterium]|nr:cytochrome c-type biogenesis protein CcmH [Clostridia bacterium]
MRKRTTIRIAQALAVFALAMTLMGAGDADEVRYKRLGHAMMCMCGCNQILLECNHVGCSYSTKMSAQLKEAVLRGDSDDAIRQQFINEYGMTVLAAPTTTGFNRVAWIMPFAVFALALGAVVVVVRTWKLRRAPAPVASAAAAGEQVNDYRRRAREETEL